MGWMGGPETSLSTEQPKAKFNVQLIGPEGFQDQEWDDVLEWKLDTDFMTYVLTRTNGRKTHVLVGTASLVVEELVEELDD